jgi:hypothetical protein
MLGNGHLRVSRLAFRSTTSLKLTVPRHCLRNWTVSIHCVSGDYRRGHLPWSAEPRGTSSDPSERHVGTREVRADHRGLRSNGAHPARRRSVQFGGRGEAVRGARAKWHVPARSRRSRMMNRQGSPPPTPLRRDQELLLPTRASHCSATPACLPAPGMVSRVEGGGTESS